MGIKRSIPAMLPSFDELVRSVCSGPAPPPPSLSPRSEPNVILVDKAATSSQCSEGWSSPIIQTSEPEVAVPATKCVPVLVNPKRNDLTCQICVKKFARQGALDEHIRTHTGERPFRCSHCDKGFATKGNMRAHERIHTGERPFACKKCGRAFNQSSHLKQHMRTHQKGSAKQPR